MENQNKLKERVIRSAESLLEYQSYVSFLDVLMRMGWLQHVHVQDWKKGKLPHLEDLIQGHPSKKNYIMEFFQAWVLEKALKPHKVASSVRSRDSNKHLQVTKSGDAILEEAYQTYYTSPLLSEKEQEKLKKKLAKPPELVAFIILKPSQCSQCDKELGKGNLLYVEGKQSFCLDCAGFGDLVYLSRGDAALTRLAKKYSGTSLVVVQFNRTRKRYERQGLLIQEDALQRAENELKTK